MLWLLIICLHPDITHQSLFRTAQQNFFALKKPLLLPGPLPQPQPIMLTNQPQPGQHPVTIPSTEYPHQRQFVPHRLGQSHPGQLQGTLPLEEYSHQTLLHQQHPSGQFQRPLLIPPKKGPMPIGQQFPLMPMFTSSPPAQKIGIPFGMPPQMVPHKTLMMPPKGPQWPRDFNSNGFIPRAPPQRQIENIPTEKTQLDNFQPLMITSQSVISVTSEGNRIFSDNVTSIPAPEEVTPSGVDIEKQKSESQLIFTRENEQPWKPIEISEADINAGPINFVLGQSNMSSSEEGENLPQSQPLIGPPPNFNSNQYHREDVREKPGKLESIKRGIYGILFGRKGPPRPPERHHPPPHLKPNLEPSKPVPNRWQPMENELKLLTEGSQNERNDRINCKMFTNDVCVDVNEYPFDLIMEDLMRDTRRINDMYVDVTDQEKYELLDGISASEERAYNYEHYFGTQKNSHSHRDYGQDGGNICPSEVTYARPKRGRKLNGEWKFIVNVPQFPQTVRLERCLKPQSKCSYVGPHLDSQCSQLHTLQRMLVWDPQRRLHTEMLLFPSACSCYLIPITDQLISNNSTTPSTNDIPSHWSEDTMDEIDIFNSQEAITDNTGNRRRKFTSNQSLLGPYSRTLKKYTRANAPERPHTNFGRPLVSEKSYVHQKPNEEFGERKVNFNQHPTSDYFQPWN